MSGYGAPVLMILTRLALLLALLLMPLGMAPLASAAASSAGHHQAMGDCPDDGSSQPGNDGIAECAMACAGALPAAEPAGRGLLPTQHQRMRMTASHQLHGLHPETATPPPKAA